MSDYCGPGLTSAGLGILTREVSGPHGNEKRYRIQHNGADVIVRVGNDGSEYNVIGSGATGTTIEFASLNAAGYLLQDLQRLATACERDRSTSAIQHEMDLMKERRGLADYYNLEESRIEGNTLEEIQTSAIKEAQAQAARLDKIRERHALATRCTPENKTIAREFMQYELAEGRSASRFMAQQVYLPEEEAAPALTPAQLSSLGLKAPNT